MSLFCWKLSSLPVIVKSMLLVVSDVISLLPLTLVIWLALKLLLEPWGGKAARLFRALSPLRIFLFIALVYVTHMLLVVHFMPDVVEPEMILHLTQPTMGWIFLLSYGLLILVVLFRFFVALFTCQWRSACRMFVILLAVLAAGIFILLASLLFFDPRAEMLGAKILLL